jgi:hypothetical protein
MSDIAAHAKANMPSRSTRPSISGFMRVAASDDARDEAERVRWDTLARGGRWVSTLAIDIEPGDTIRRNGQERYVLGRDHPPAHQPTFRLSYVDGQETIAKTARVAIWDPDGSVIERVESLSDKAAVFAAASAINRIACGFVELER